MITQELLDVKTIKVKKGSIVKELRVGLFCHNGAETWYVENNNKVFKPLTNITVLNYLRTHDIEGVLTRVPFEWYSEKAQIMCDNRVYCFIDDQSILLRNEEFCTVLCDTFNISHGMSPVDVIQELDPEKSPQELYLICQKILSNSFITLDAMNRLRAVLSFRSRYVSAAVIASFKKIAELFDSETEVDLFLTAVAVMNTDSIRKRIIELKHKLGKGWTKDTSPDVFVDEIIDETQIGE